MMINGVGVWHLKFVGNRFLKEKSSDGRKEGDDEYDCASESEKKVL